MTTPYRLSPFRRIIGANFGKNGFGFKVTADLVHWFDDPDNEHVMLGFNSRIETIAEGAGADPAYPYASFGFGTIDPGDGGVNYLDRVDPDTGDPVPFLSPTAIFCTRCMFGRSFPIEGHTEIDITQVTMLFSLESDLNPYVGDPPDTTGFNGAQNIHVQNIATGKDITFIAAGDYIADIYDNVLALGWDFLTSEGDTAPEAGVEYAVIFDNTGRAS